MHELTFVDGIIRHIGEKKRTFNFSKVSLIGLISGRYNCLSQDSLQFCFDAIAKGTYMEGARLEIEKMEISHHCPGCGEVFKMNEGVQACPKCKRTEVEEISPDAVYIKNLEVET